MASFPAAMTLRNWSISTASTSGRDLASAEGIRSCRRNLGVATCRRRQPLRAAASTNGSNGGGKAARPLAYDHVMLAILDANPYLSDGSKQAASMAAGLAASSGKGRVTVLLVDEKQRDDNDTVTRMDVLTGQLRGNGCTDFEVLDQVAPRSAAAALGDVADAREADLLVVSCDAVHSKAVDANLLAEFVPCPIMLLP